MLLRFLCSRKTFLNYVTDVYMYLKVTGGISYSQTHLAFQHLAPEAARWSVASRLLHARKRVNHIGTMVSQSVSPAQAHALCELPGSCSPLLFLLFPVPLPHGAVNDEPRRTWTFLWATLSPPQVMGAGPHLCAVSHSRGTTPGCE